MTILNGDSEILKSIAGNVKEWAGNWDSVFENIELRGKVKQKLVDMAEREKDDRILEAQFVINANDQFHKISDKVKEDTGKLDSKKILFRWEEWLKQEVKRMKSEGKYG